MSAPRRILMLTTQLGYGGAETSFIRLANFLAQSMDVTVALFTASYGHASNYAVGHEQLHTTIVTLDAPQGQARLQRWVQRIRRVRALKKQHDATISFLSGPNVVNVLAGCNHGTIVSLRGSRMYDPVAPRFQRFLFQYFLDPVVYALATAIVPVSDGLKNEIRRVSRGRTLNKVHVISPFIERSSMQLRFAEPAPAPYATLKGQPIIVAAGRMSVEKGFHHLIRVVAALAPMQPGVKLLLIGDGPMMHSLRELCATYGLAVDDATPGVSAVLFAGYQKNVLPLMALGRAYAMTSATEGFPSVLLEAMAAGLSVVAADAPWGARSILCATPSDSRCPYPTRAPTRVDYGTLMPRIDVLAYEALWVQTLGDILAADQKPNAATTLRLDDYELVNVGKKWKKLLATIEAS